MDGKITSVTDLVLQIKKKLETNFRVVSVQGEITNFSSSGAGHYYFTLSDEESSLSCCLFKMDAMRNPVIRKVNNGTKIIADGSVGVYGKRGTFQLIVRRLTLDGVGDLKRQLEELKRRLAGEGLFDLEIKKPIPTYPKRVGLITAFDSAAYHDFLNVSQRRGQRVNILVAPALVQGKNAVKSLRKSLFNLIAYHMNAEETEKLDVIVLCRGGGSLEDLWSFNDEGLAWDIYNCPIPVISAVGHEVDFSISDLVADKRCETPTAAAEILTAGQVALVTKMRDLERRVKSCGRSFVERKLRDLDRFSPHKNLRKIEYRFYEYSRRLELCKIEDKLIKITGLHDKLMRVEECWRSLRKFKEQVGKINEGLETKYSLLKLLNPKNILGRGYTYIEDPEEGTLVRNVEVFDKKEDSALLNIYFSDGKGVVFKKINNTN